LNPRESCGRVADTDAERWKNVTPGRRSGHTSVSSRGQSRWITRSINEGSSDASLVFDAGLAHAGIGTGDARRELRVSEEPRTSPRGRDARTEHFTTVKKAREHPSTHVVERVPKPGYGDTKKK
jgi:hypothetical protein